jgi:multidrug efflux pump subunit AcrA (membrane-fusion protein)
MRISSRSILGFLAAVALVGCGHEAKTKYPSVTTPPTVRLIQPETRNLLRTVGQPSFIVSYERTSIYPKMTAYIEKWVADIGDKVKKDDVLATLFVPELVENYGTKKAVVKLDEERIELAKKRVEVAAADVKAARAEVVETKAILGKYDAEVERWQVEIDRLAREAARTVVAPQILLESKNELKSNLAARDAARATIAKSEAELLSAEATLAKAKVDVAVAEADLAVAQSEERRLKAWVGYLTLTAPFDGVVAARNANTFDFVLPSTGDPTAMPDAPHLSPSGAAAPIYVIDRTDIVRVFIDIPEGDADYVHGSDLRLMPTLKDVRELPSTGREMVVLARVQDALHVRIFDSDSKAVVDAKETEMSDKNAKDLDGLKAVLQDAWGAPRVSPLDKDRILAILAAMFGRTRVPIGTKGSVLVRAYRDDPIEGYVTRTSWALNVKSRTLRAEIDLPNPGSALLPGMYAYAKVIIERPGARTLPLDALTYSGDRTFCWLYKDGRAVRAEVRTGVSDGDWIEVTNLQRTTAAGDENGWVPVDGSEQVILGDLSILADGGAVEVASEGRSGTKVASAAQTGDGR